MKIYHVLKCSLSPRQVELAKKKICRIFQENGFRITTQANFKSVNFLDINLNLESGLFKPYMKPNDTPVYVHKDSNHPRSILDNIPKSVNRRLSAIFSNQQVFEVACPPPYQAALNKSGYNYKLNFDPQCKATMVKEETERYYISIHPSVKMCKQRLGNSF